MQAENMKKLLEKDSSDSKGFPEEGGSKKKKRFYFFWKLFMLNKHI